MPIYVDRSNTGSCIYLVSLFCGRPPNLVNSKIVLRNLNKVEAQVMFDHGMYRCDNNKDQHFIDSIVHKKNSIADGGVFHTRTILFTKPGRTTQIYQ